MSDDLTRVIDHGVHVHTGWQYHRPADQARGRCTWEHHASGVTLDCGRPEIAGTGRCIVHWLIDNGIDPAAAMVWIAEFFRDVTARVTGDVLLIPADDTPAGATG